VLLTAITFPLADDWFCLFRRPQRLGIAQRFEINMRLTPMPQVSMLRSLPSLVYSAMA
jgi:hypothetical protein